MRRLSSSKEVAQSSIRMRHQDQSAPGKCGIDVEFDWQDKPGGRWPPGLSRVRFCYFLVAQNISAIASISLSNLSATAMSLVFFASPAVLVAVQNISCSVGYVSRCTGLK